MNTQPIYLVATLFAALFGTAFAAPIILGFAAWWLDVVFDFIERKTEKRLRKFLDSAPKPPEPSETIKIANELFGSSPMYKRGAKK